MQERHVWCFAGALLLLGGSHFAPRPALAQDPDGYTIQGTVVDAQSTQPLSDVAVAIRGTSLGTLTDLEGRYQIAASLPAGSYTLEYSFLGRGTVTREVELGGEATVTLEPVGLEQSAVQLEQIVVTGSGVSAVRKSVANTVESIAGEEVTEAPAASTIDQALQGKLTGALISETSGQPGGGVTIRLRGVSSILGGAEPLVVVDGVIIDNDNGALVSLAGNSVRGSAGLSNRLADLAPADIESIEVLKGPAAAALYGSRANNGVIQIFTRSGRQGEPRITFSTEASVSQTPARYDLLLDYPYAGPADLPYLPEGAAVGDPVERFDVQDMIFQTGVGTTNHLSISGGNDRTTYYIAGTYANETGIIRSTDYDKRGARVNLTQRLSDELQVSANANFVQTLTNFVTGGEQTTGVLTTAIFQPTVFDPRFDEELGRYPYGLLGANPLDVIENWEFPQEVVRFLGSAEARWTPVEDLTVRYLFGVDDYRQESKYFQPRGSTTPADVGTISNPVRLSRQINSDVTATHTADFGSSLTLGSTVGFRYTSDRGEVILSGASDLPPGQKTVGGADLSTGQSISEFHTVGGFVQEQLGISSSLFLTAGLNVEASSAFGEEQRWQLFPRAGVSWSVNDAPFWSDAPGSDFISTLRLRLAYGETGGQPPGLYTRFDNYDDVAFSERPGLTPSSLAGNPNLSPEREREYEGGFDIGFFDDRVDLSFSYYDQRTSDLVLSVPQPLSSGYDNRFENVGVVTNRGVELSLTTINLRRSGFTWRSRLSYSANRNNVEELIAGTDMLSCGASCGYLNAVIVGEPIGAFYGWYYARDAQGEIIIDPATGLGQRAQDENGVALQKVLGSPHPDFQGALRNTFTFGDNLELDVLFDGRFGNDVANFSRRISEFFGAAAIVQDEVDRLMAMQGDETLGPLQYSGNSGRLLNYEEYVEDGSFVKLREVALAYTLPRPWLEPLGMEGVTLRLAGRNLYTWTDYSGLDPEINLFAGNTVAQGVDFGVAPVPRSYVLGATFTF